MSKVEIKNKGGNDIKVSLYQRGNPKPVLHIIPEGQSVESNVEVPNTALAVEDVPDEQRTDQELS